MLVAHASTHLFARPWIEGSEYRSRSAGACVASIPRYMAAATSASVISRMRAAARATMASASELGAAAALRARGRRRRARRTCSSLPARRGAGVRCRRRA
jgi:hypothetical protein